MASEEPSNPIYMMSGNHLEGIDVAHVNSSASLLMIMDEAEKWISSDTSLNDKTKKQLRYYFVNINTYITITT